MLQKVKVIGFTPEGQKIVSGMFFPITSWLGLPLEDVVYLLYKQNMVINWMDFYIDAIKNGWHPKRTINKICVCLEENFGKDYSLKVKQRFEYIDKMNYGAFE